MKYTCQAGIATNGSWSRVSFGQQMSSVVSLDHFVLLFLFCRQVKTSALSGGTPEIPQISGISICVCRTERNWGKWFRISGGNKHLSNTEFCFFAYACVNKSKKNFTKHHLNVSKT